MNHLKIPETNRNLYLPEDLSECDERQYIEMAALIFRFQCGEIDYEAFRVQAVYKLLDMARGKAGLYDDEKYAGVWRLSQLINSFFDEDDNGNKVIKQHYVHNPVPSFRGGFSRYYGPADGFDNIKVGEYLEGLNCFIDFTDTGEMKYLYQLLAIFYRPKKKGIAFKKLLNAYNGDIRAQYNAATVQARAKRFEKQHIGVVFGFYLLFASFQKYLATAVLFIEGKEIDMSVLFDDSGSKKYKESDLPGLGLKSLVYSFAESGVFGPMKDILDLPVWELFLRMYDLTKKSKDLEANEPSK